MKNAALINEMASELVANYGKENAATYIGGVVRYGNIGNLHGLALGAGVHGMQYINAVAELGAKGFAKLVLNAINA